jgi:hypothetical protein
MQALQASTRKQLLEAMEFAQANYEEDLNRFSNMHRYFKRSMESYQAVKRLAQEAGADSTMEVPGVIPAQLNIITSASSTSSCAPVMRT